MARAKEAYTKPRGIEPGKRLRIPFKYLLDAVDTVRLTGFILIQTCWRKWAKTEHHLADKAFLDFTYDTLVDERYELTTKASTFASSVKVDEPILKTIILNHAIALRDMRQYERMRKLLNSTSWPQKAMAQLALCVLREEYDRTYALLPTAISEAKEVSRLEYKRMYEWPLFKPIRNEPKFISIFSGAAVQ